MTNILTLAILSKSRQKYAKHITKNIYTKEVTIQTCRKLNKEVCLTFLHIQHCLTVFLPVIVCINI